MGGFLRTVPTLSEVCRAGPDIYRPIGKFRVDGIIFRVERLTCPSHGQTRHTHQLHLTCDATTATDRRTSPPGANSERAELAVAKY